MSNSQLDCTLCKVEFTCTCYMRGGPSCVGPVNWFFIMSTIGGTP